MEHTKGVCSITNALAIDDDFIETFFSGGRTKYPAETIELDLRRSGDPAYIAELEKTLNEKAHVSSPGSASVTFQDGVMTIRGVDSIELRFVF